MVACDTQFIDISCCIVNLYNKLLLKLEFYQNYNFILLESAVSYEKGLGACPRPVHHTVCYNVINYSR